jgi:hypothetical protein
MRSMTLLVLFLSFGAAACSGPPRNEAYFEAHPQEAAAVVAACRRGAARGAECRDAQSAIATAARDARMARFRKAF